MAAVAQSAPRAVSRKPQSLPGWVVILAPVIRILLSGPRRILFDAAVARTRKRAADARVFAAQRAAIEKEAQMFEQVIIERLTRLGFAWRGFSQKNLDSEPKTSKAVKVKFECHWFNEQIIEYKISVSKRGLFRMKDQLPYNVRVGALKSDETLIELSAACQRKITLRPTNYQQGTWYVLHRNEGGGMLPTLVRFNHILERHNPEGLSVILGVGENNTIHEVDLENIAHLLIAGAAGGGKSNQLNAVIAQFALFHSPAEIGFIMIDPKKVELSFYAKLPHLMRQIIFKIDEAIQVLIEANQWIDERTDLMYPREIKKLSEWNERYPDRAFKRIVIVIEEMASLWDSDKGRTTVHNLLTRIANMGRAPGVHLMLVTQIPIKSVIPTKIKGNVLVRMATRCPSPVESQIIIGTGDAAWIPGIRGRMVYAVDADKHEIQTPYITNEQVQESVAIARGKHEGLIRYEMLIVIPQPEMILWHIAHLLAGDMRMQSLIEYFKGFGLSWALLKEVIAPVLREGGCTIKGQRYTVNERIHRLEPVERDVPPPSNTTIIIENPTARPEVLMLPAPKVELTGHDLKGIAERRATCIYKQTPKVAALIRGLKTDPSYAEPLAQRLADEYRRAGWDDATLIVPVPMFPEKLKERGFNQAESLATAFAALVNIPCKPDALERLRDTGTQRSRARATLRVDALKDAFSANPAIVKGQTVILIDDVITSGATMESCGQALIEAGAAKVYGLAVASGFLRKQQK